MHLSVLTRCEHQLAEDIEFFLSAPGMFLEGQIVFIQLAA